VVEVVVVMVVEVPAVVEDAKQVGVVEEVESASRVVVGKEEAREELHLLQQVQQQLLNPCAEDQPALLLSM